MEVKSLIVRNLVVPRKGIRTVASVGALAAATVGLASCGSSSTLTANQTTSTTTASSRTSQAAYTSCLAAHGFTFPKFDPTSKNPPTTVPASVRNAAVAACAGRGGGPGSGGFTISKTELKAIQVYTDCLKAHGVTVASSATQSGGPAEIRALSQQPGFSSASQACASLRPKIGRPQTFSSNNSSTTTTVG